MATNRTQARSAMKAANKAAVAAAKAGDRDALRQARDQQEIARRDLAAIFPDGGHPDGMLGR